MADSPLRVLEFYSGIGGLRYSLEDSGVRAVVVEAFDINEVANDVYEHNFGHRPCQGNIQGLSVQQLEKYKADAWLLSPPCQPYTRQGLQKDTDDARASSFLKILQLLPLMTDPPTHLLVENVVGFENSVTHNRLLMTLEDAGFETQEFILSPLQFGIPYSRPRYFCLAKRKPKSFTQPDYNGQLLCKPGPLFHFIGNGMKLNSVVIGENTAKTDLDGCGAQNHFFFSNGGGQNLPTEPKRNDPLLDPAMQCKPVKYYLESNPDIKEAILNQVAKPACREGIQQLNCSQQVSLDLDPEDPKEDMRTLDQRAEMRQNTEFLQEDQWELYKVPLNVVQRWIDAYDIVTPDSRRCCCFTKSYTRYAKGTGSFLATKVSFEEGEGKTLEKYILDLRLQGQSLSALGLRYFTPREVANLHSFPNQFRFPTHVRLKQRYALLGNSLSVAVVGCLLKYLFSASTMKAPSN